MGLYKRENVWWMGFAHRGMHIRRSTGVTDKKLAEKIYCKVRTQVAEGKWLDVSPAQKKTVRELLEKYMNEYSSVNKAPLSFRRDNQVKAHLNNYFGNFILSEISPKLISDYKNKRRTEKAAPATINKELQLFSHAFNLAMKEWEWVRENPVSRVSKEKDRSAIERWLTLEEQEKLLAVSPRWLKEIIIFAINTGLRQSEILNLEWREVDFLRKVILITKQKNGEESTVILIESTLSILKDRSKVRPLKNNLVFHNTNGNKIDGGNLRRDFYAACKRAGIEKLRFHDLRHTFATRLVQGGVDIYAVQNLGRWKTLSMVTRYAHHNPESLRSAIETLDKVHSNSVTFLSQSRGN